MSLKVCVLASGSSGNCIYVASETTGILIDAGLSYQQTAARLESVGVSPSSLAGLCVTHEHNDHVSGLGVLHRKLGLAPYGNEGTMQAIEQNGKMRDLPWCVFTTGSSFEIGDLTLYPFSVPHDSYDPVGFVVRCRDVEVGVVTDMGVVTELIRQRLKACSIIVIEANHDEDLLRTSARPWPLKQRIAGVQGHLSNERAAELLSDIAGPHLKTVLLAHLSADCNRPDLAVKTVRKALAKAGYGQVGVEPTYPDCPTRLICL